ncbi:Flagellar basal-body rod protein FlgF [hydrothermal vent metagenome]|uniref:Flagellar basal-body rod protein FlgF n=1 Tax=hydrothermal vent metagenome TaxID=652676 RepID=A0A3B0TYJ9_9ZZZZ
MENAQLISLSRQIGLQRQMNVVANNVANLNTTGFKAEQLLFAQYIMPVAKDRGFTTPDQQLIYTQDWATINDFSAGAIAQTGNNLDVALQGKGFLTVETPDGERFTRSGALQINNQGLLVDNNGYPVLGQGGQIRFGPGESGIQFAQDGSVSSSAGAKGNLRIVEFTDPQALVREGSNLFSGGSPVAAKDTRVVQGALEKSNVSSVLQIAEMIRVNRTYQSMAQLAKRQDELRRSAISTLGNLAG